MIKKLLLMGTLALFAKNVHAQDLGQAESIQRNSFLESSNTAHSKIAAANIVDTLWYFYNKHFYRNPANTGFYTFKNANTYTSTTAITMGGAVFQNTGSIVITGAEGVAARQASSPSPSVNIGLFLYNVTGGVPTGAPIASVSAMVTGTAGSYFGGSFSTPVIVTGDYALMMKNVSSNNQDTIRMFINNALTATSTSTVTARKYGEGLGLIGVASGFTTTTDVFGAGTDFEFLVAPRVAYSVTAVAAAPAGSCIGVAYTFTNNSSPWLGHRQYNLNEFAVRWLPFANTASTTIMPDPVYSWNFGDATAPTATSGTATTVNHTFASPGTFTGTLTANHQKMSDYNNNKTTDAATWTKTYSNCSVGINELKSAIALNLYPNPTVNGKTSIAGLEGTNVITVYNMLGQVVSTISTDKEVVSIDLSAQMAGNYLVRITNSNNQTKTVKVINN